jgi:hypothetical protein
MPRLFRLLFVLILCSLAYAQAPDPPAGEGSAVVIFDLDFPESQPEHYSIRVPSVGAAHYQSTGRVTADSDATDSFDLDFPISSAMRTKILALAARAGYFQKDLDSHRKGMAFTGKKTLTYKDAEHAGESTYNFSLNPAVQELTTVFQNLSSTLEFGHRLDYDRRYQKLALNEELKRMQEMAHTDMLVEVGAIHPILEQIVADQSVVNVARARAQSLLDGVGR